MRTAVKYIMVAFASVLAGCDRMEGPFCPEGSSEVSVQATGEDFVQTRSDDKAADDEEIGAGESGLNYGQFYLIQTTAEGNEDKWGLYEVANGKKGELSPVGDNRLFWADLHTEYYYRALSVPPGMNGKEAGVTFDYDEATGTQSGTVHFGDYTKGLEYFVGVTVGPTSLNKSPRLRMRFKRQVCKVIFLDFERISKGSNKPIPVEQCRIMFPNLPKTATFDMEHFRAKAGVHDPAVPLKEGNDYVTLEWGDEMGVEMTWNKINTAVNAESNLKHAFYLPPFKFWDGDSNDPEDQPGFFVVTITDEKGEELTYTGNLYGDGNAMTLRAGDYHRLRKIVLKDGPTVTGGDGSAIGKWEFEGETDSPHHPQPGLYSQEDADVLLDVLLKGEEIPFTFWREDETTGKKVIRLFNNIDWSQVTGEIRIPDGYVLAGQGFNITLGSGATLSGEVEGTLYVNGELYSLT